MITNYNIDEVYSKIPFPSAVSKVPKLYVNSELVIKNPKPRVIITEDLPIFKKIFICHNDSEVINQLTSAFNNIEEKRKNITITSFITNNEFECMFKLQNDYKNGIIYDAFITGDNYKIIDTYTVLNSIHSMINKKTLNNLSFVTICNENNNGRIIGSQVILNSLGNIIYYPFNLKDIENLIDELLTK